MRFSVSYNSRHTVPGEQLFALLPNGSGGIGTRLDSVRPEFEYECQLYRSHSGELPEMQ